MWTRENLPDQSGKTVIVTGANTGIGIETAKGLYEKGADVTIACRDESKAKEAVKKIESIKGKGSLSIGILNLNSLKDIVKFCDEFKSNHQKLDILINNAGVMIPPADFTEDQFELQFGVNFIGHFALTGHLFPLLKESSAARIITVTSGAATFVEGIDFNNLRLEKPYDPMREYGVSKLANVLFSLELDRKLKKIESNIVSVAVHPGVVYTDLQRHIPSEFLETAFAKFKEVSEPWQGALPSLYAAGSPLVKGGDFYGPDGENEYTGYPALSGFTTTAINDEKLAEQLWIYAQKASGLKFPF